ncbi:amidase [Neobacillus mesonae]|uniref:amidase n=1 Tax=Neobacillus mesonae TaxID=1193713 RepID=UPI00204242FC|nr:amidase [Neobacillus mesonae]MCM3569726.1 amidase [Neobacillus mesonae]
MTTFNLEEATIDSIHDHFISGELSCRELVENYLRRIEEYDQNGPNLNSIITINPTALQEAEELDRVFQQTGEFVGPLHGIPIVVKDQLETKDITTTYGSIAYKDYLPEEDATVIKKLRQAGGIILAKTNLPDFATAWFTFSSATGDTKNPYALNRDPGGSSGGTAAAIAANLATVGIGEDTGGSIRVPASFTNLFGLRVSTGLISRKGTSPLVHFQDTAGPMTRTVKDMAILLDSIVGYDSNDSMTAVTVNAKDAGNYSKQLTAKGLQGARIGILRDAFGPDSDPSSAEVNQVTNRVIQSLSDAGAEIIDPVTIPNLSALIEKTSMYTIQSKKDFNDFLGNKNVPYNKTVDELYETKQYHDDLDLFIEIAKGPENPEEVPGYFEQRLSQSEFRQEIEKVFAEHQLDAILFPDVQVLPPTKEEVHSGNLSVLSYPTNTVIASQTGLPAISMPGGLTDDGIPVGVELLGKQLDEARLLQLAYSYEYFAKPRKKPSFKHELVK